MNDLDDFRVPRPAIWRNTCLGNLIVNVRPRNLPLDGPLHIMGPASTTMEETIQTSAFKIIKVFASKDRNVHVAKQNSACSEIDWMKGSLPVLKSFASNSHSNAAVFHWKIVTFQPIAVFFDRKIARNSSGMFRSYHPPFKGPPILKDPSSNNAGAQCILLKHICMKLSQKSRKSWIQICTLMTCPCLSLLVHLALQWSEHRAIHRKCRFQLDTKVQYYIILYI